MHYRNFYACPRDGARWTDEWDCACNDRCPTCNAEIEPYRSDDLTPHLWDVRVDGPWWNAPPERSFEAYYMTLRVHYELPAAEAFAKAKANGPLVGVGVPGGLIGMMREALRGRP